MFLAHIQVARSILSKLALARHSLVKHQATRGVNRGSGTKKLLGRLWRRCLHYNGLKGVAEQTSILLDVQVSHRVGLNKRLYRLQIAHEL